MAKTFNEFVDALGGGGDEALTGEESAAAAADTAAAVQPATAAPAPPAIGSFLRASLQSLLPASRSYALALERAQRLGGVVDECGRGVKFSPDGSCLLTATEAGAQISRLQRKQPRRKRRAAAPQEECKQADASMSSGSSDTDSSDSDHSDSDSDPSPPPLDADDRSGLSLFELPPMHWTPPSGAHERESACYTFLGAAASAQPAPPLPFPPAAVRARPGDSLYDFVWNPSMHSSYAPSCWFLSTSRASPIHCWDAFTGALRASWSGYDQMDELEAALSLCVSPVSHEMAQPAKVSIYAGYNKCIRVFDKARPGRDCVRIATTVKPSRAAKNPRGGRGRASTPALSQSGIISTIAINPAHRTLMAAGSYNGEVGLYDLAAASSGSCLEHKSFLDSHGVSEVKFSNDGLHMFVALRHAPRIDVFDMRQASEPCAVLARANGTNQRMQFDVDASGRWLVTGDTEGQLLVFDLQSSMTDHASGSASSTGLLPVFHQRVSADPLHGVSLHPSFSSTAPIVATQSGGRKFFMRTDDDDGAEADVEQRKRKLATQEPAPAAGAVAVSETGAPPLPVNSIAVWALQHTGL